MTMDEGDESGEKVLLGILDLGEAKRLRNILAEKGIRSIELISNPETCRCGPGGSQVEVHAAEADAPAFLELVKSERAKLLDGLDAHPGHDAAVDLDQATATCPACGTEFSTTAAECPECGLGFSTPTGLPES